MSEWEYFQPSKKQLYLCNSILSLIYRLQENPFIDEIDRSINPVHHPVSMRALDKQENKGGGRMLRTLNYWLSQLGSLCF